MKVRIKQLTDEINALYANTMDEVEILRIKYLSKKGEVSALFNDFRNVPNDEKREIGQLLNDLKNLAQDKINGMKETLSATGKMEKRNDLTRTAEPVKLGTRHPLMLVKQEIAEIFSRIGFTISEGPEIEDDWHVFGALNFPPEHPARDMQDTFFIEKNPDVLLRTHTSSVQTRIMSSQQPPIRMIFPGQIPVSLFDFLIGGGPGNSQDLVWIVHSVSSNSLIFFLLGRWKLPSSTAFPT